MQANLGGSWRLLLVLGLSLSMATSSALGQAQTSILSLDVDFIGGALSYARAFDEAQDRYWGLEAGLGGPFWSRMLLSGRHFADEDGPSYETRDGAEDKQLIEMLHLTGFHRKATDRVHWDTGLRASLFFHFDSSDDDPGVALFGGAYTGFLWGNRWLKVGPELLVGVFAEPGIPGEFGILLTPLTGRVSLSW